MIQNDTEAVFTAFCNTTKQILFFVCYFNKNPLFAEVIQVTYFTTAFSLKLDSISPFSYTFTTPLCTSKT